MKVKFTHLHEAFQNLISTVGLYSLQKAIVEVEVIATDLVNSPVDCFKLKVSLGPMADDMSKRLQVHETVIYGEEENKPPYSTSVVTKVLSGSKPGETI